MVRSWLDREEVVPLLLENVAGTILGVEMAWGLASSFLFNRRAVYSGDNSVDAAGPIPEALCRAM